MRLLAPLLLLGFSLAAQEPVDFTKQIAPILVQRCIECHGPEDQEGDLRLDAKEHVFIKGDEDFWSVLPEEPDDSELIRRLGLDLDDEELMPARGEPLTAEQRELFRRWVAEGAKWPVEGDDFIASELAAQVIPKITFDLPELSDAQRAKVDAAIQAMRSMGGVVQRIAADTDAVEVNLSLLRDKVTDETLRQLEVLAPVLVWLNASRTNIGEGAGVHLAKLTQLRRLNLSGTSVGDRGIAGVEGLQQLEYLNVYGTQVGDAGLASIAALPALKQLYLWQSKATQSGVAKHQDALAGVQVDLGDYVEARLDAARQEIADREARNTPVNERCPVSGTKVDPKFFVLHEDRRIAFCCGKCKAKFEKDPAAFAAKLPSAEARSDAEASPINDKCPVSGAAVDAAHTVTHEGRLVGFCCGKCKAKFSKDPKPFLAKLPPKK